MPAQNVAQNLADLVVKNARILTMDATRPTASAVAVTAGRISAVGSDAEVMALAGPQTRVVDAGGRSVLPGFFESHLHLGLGGNELGHLHLTGQHGMDAMTKAFRAFAAKHPDRPLLMAQGSCVT